MSERRLFRKPRTRREVINGAQATATTFSGWGNNGHQGADSSRLRGYVYFPELDTRREISTYTRTEMLRKGRFLYANHGIAKRVVNGLARMVAGTGLTPQATTRDRAWNRDAEKAFANATNSPFVFDVGGRYNFPKSQQAQLRFAYRDGDAATVLASSQAGGARFAFYEGHNIGSDAFDANQTGWRDGVRLDDNNRARAYRFLGLDGKSPKDIPAEDVIFFADYERAGQSRGLTVLSHAINHLLDSAEITSYIKTGVKLANQYGYWVEYAQGATKPPQTAAARAGGTKNTEKIETSAGPVTVEKIYGAGAIPDLPPGATLKFNSASHPHPNNLSLIEFLIRDIAWGVGLSPEILWNIAALGGANTRFVLADAQGWIEEQQANLVRIYNSRVWVYTIAKLMKTGALRRPSDPEWWAHAWIPPPRLTVDFGRDGKLHLEQLKMGAITMTRLLGWQGQDFEEHTNKWLDEIAFVKAGLNAENRDKFKPGEDGDRNLTWDDIQQWRNVVGFRPDYEAQNGGGTAEDGAPTDPNQASAFLAELAKDPKRAAEFLSRQRAMPEAA
jgi:capsid protein